MAKKTVKKMTLNQNHYTVAANDIIKGKQTMTLQVAKLIRLLITQVVKQDKELQTYSVRITELADFFETPPNNLYRDIQDICEGAMKSVVYIGSKDPSKPWKMFHWVSRAEYDGEGTVKLRLSDEIKPYVLELDKWFTQYQLKNILQFNSYYAIRLYELLRCDSGIFKDDIEFEYDVDELRLFFQCEKKYKLTADFKRKVIDVGMREINEKSDLKITCKAEHKGKKITGYIFEVHMNLAAK